MIYVRGRFYDETQDHESILDEVEDMRRDPVDNSYEMQLFRPPIRSAHGELIRRDRISAVARERQRTSLPHIDDEK